MPDQALTSISQLRVLAYMHQTADHCVSTDPTAYDKPRQLVALDDVIDVVGYIESGLSEWRTYAVDAGRELAKARAEIQRLKGEAARPSRGTEVPQGFAAFWDAWPAGPRKVNKKACLTRWVAGKLEPMAEQIVAHVQASKIGRDWTKNNGDYIPAPLVYLNQERYLAPPAAPAHQPGSLGGMNYKPAGVDEHGHFN